MEEEIDPYASPQADLSVAPDFGDGRFGHLSYKQVARLRNHSHSIRALGLVALIFIVGATLLAVGGNGSILGLVIGMFCVPGIISCWWRPGWGQAGGIVFCCVLMLGFPIGTVLGICGIVAFAQSGASFGPGRFWHNEIEQEWRARKLARKSH